MGDNESKEFYLNMDVFAVSIPITKAVDLVILLNSSPNVDFLFVPSRHGVNHKAA